MSASDSFVGAALVPSPYAELRAENERLRQALRHHVIVYDLFDSEKLIRAACLHCGGEWDTEEKHAEDCEAK